MAALIISTVAAVAFYFDGRIRRLQAEQLVKMARQQAGDAHTHAVAQSNRISQLEQELAACNQVALAARAEADRQRDLASRRK